MKTSRDMSQYDLPGRRTNEPLWYGKRLWQCFRLAICGRKAQVYCHLFAIMDGWMDGWMDG